MKNWWERIRNNKKAPWFLLQLGQEACSSSYSSSPFCPAEWNESRQPEVACGTNTHPTPLTLQAVLVFQPLWVLKWLIWYGPQWIVQDAEKTITKAIKNPEINHVHIFQKKIPLIFTMCVLNKFNKNQPKKWKRINGGLEAAFLIITTHYPSSKTIHMALYLQNGRFSSQLCEFTWNVICFFPPCFWREKFNKYSVWTSLLTSGNPVSLRNQHVTHSVPPGVIRSKPAERQTRN